jgi:hypothetical protein
MAVDTTRQGSKGGDPQYNPELRGVSEERGIVVGIVKANVHGSHMGVIQVFIPEMSTDEEDKSQWRTVRYCTPFYSRVDSTEGASNKNRYIDTKMPSGIVTPPPDLGTTVLCFFPHGKNNEGYYFACVPDTYMMQTLPEPTVVEDFENGPYIGGELNDKKNNPNDIVNWKTQLRPEDFITQKIVKEQGLVNDKVRGLNNSSYMRESPSEIIGISSKGRRITESGKDFLKENAAALKNPNTTDEKVLEGLLGPTARRKGHSIALDDGDIEGNSNQIRLRTSTGHQILLNDSEGIIYVGNSTGSVWIELGNQGTLDVFANDSINFRSKNLNFHADENIKFHSKGYTQLVSEQHMHLQSGDDFVVSSEGDTGITTKKFSVTASGQMNLSGGATASIKASGIMAVSGSLVMLQGPSLGSQSAQPVRLSQKLDPKFSDFGSDGGVTNQSLNPAGSDFGTGGKWVLSRDSTVTTSVDRLVTHEPFVGHGEKNTPSSYSGGLAGGGGLGAAFSIISTGFQIASSLPPGTFGNIPGADFSDFAGTNLFGTDVSDFAGNNLFDNFGLEAFGGAGDTVIDFSDFATGGSSTFSPGFFTDVTDTFTQISDTIGNKIQTFTDAVGDTIGKYGNSITGTNITSQDFPGIDAFGGAGTSIGGLQGDFSDFSAISPSIDSVASGGTGIGFIDDLANSNLGKLVVDGSGKIVDIAKEVADQYQADLPQIQKGLQKLSAVRSIASAAGVNVNVSGFDKLSGFLLEPKIAGFEITDVVKQLDTGFSIGDLDSTDMQGLAAAVVKVAGSNNSNSFINSTTKAMGKYGFTVDQLIAAGYVRPEAKFNDQLLQSSVWTGKDNINSHTKFLQNAGIQEQTYQQVIASNYQTLVNNGAIRPNDKSKEIMAMLTASSISNPNIVKQVRFGNASIDGPVRNTTGIPQNGDVLSFVKDAMQKGGAASDLVTNLKNKNDTGIEDLSTLKVFQGTLKTGEKLRNINGVSYVVPAPASDPYSGPNGGKKRDLDQRIAKLEKDRSQLVKDGNDDKNILDRISDTLSDLYAQRNNL